MDNFNLNSLRIFHAVARLQSFTRASEALFLTQPGISKYIKDLEEYYGIRLFDRLGKKVSLTQAGETLFSKVDRIFNLLDQAKAEIDDVKGMKGGELRIGSSITIGIYFLPDILKRFRELYPGLGVMLDIDLNRQIVEQVLGNAIDIGLLGAPVDDDRLVMTPFFTDELAVIVPCNKYWAARDRIRPDELLPENFILARNGSGTRTIVEERLKEAGISLKSTIEFGHTEAVKKAVEAGLGISIISRLAVSREEKLGLVRSIPLDGVDLRRRFYFTYRKDKYLSHAAKTFLQFIVYKDTGLG